MEIFVLHIGEYSQRGVVAVFDSKERLYEYSQTVFQDTDPDWEQYELNPDGTVVAAENLAMGKKLDAERTARHARRASGHPLIEDEAANQIDDIMKRYHP